MDANERFEELASQFKKDTGLLAPGKDAPVAAGNDPIYGQEYRWSEWLKWLEKREGKMKGKPPILSDEQIEQAAIKGALLGLNPFGNLGGHEFSVCYGVAQAQRDADVEWFGKSKCEHCDTPLLREGELYEKLEQACQETAQKIFNDLETIRKPLARFTSDGQVCILLPIVGLEILKSKYLEKLTPEEEVNKQAYKEEVEDEQRDTAGGYRYV